jgi:exodeoxyribonuclease-3
MSFIVATYNTNSVRARLPIVTDWLNRTQPDVLCLQETKAQDKDFPADAFKEAGYGAVFKGQKSYNGVAILSKHPMDDVKLNLYDTQEEEARFITTNIRGIPFVNVYAPQGFAPGTDKFAYKLRWLRDLLAYIKENLDPCQPVLMAGDFNVALEDIDVYDPETLRGEIGFHPDEQAVMKELLSWGLADIFRRHQPDGGHYTFWDYRVPNALKRKMGWRIDYILATEVLANLSLKAWIDVEPRRLERPSDHTFLVAEFNLKNL